ncbi:MAG: hypothetical protein FWC16_09545 [Defluviitaleaceae bacterium]|nr:hypothetical protein [Defluviitaleaceae bacterium]MCL2275156.1 hypothetical protein [Defluviitaleaceae bacterium]
MFKDRKAVKVITFIFAAVVLVGLYFTFNPLPQQATNADTPDEEVYNTTIADTAVSYIESGLSVVQNDVGTVYIPVPIIEPTPTIAPPAIVLLPITAEQMEQERDITDIQLTQVETAQPAPPKLPDTAFTGERDGYATLEDVEAHNALDPALTNPDVKPNLPTPTPPPITTPPATTTQPAPTTPPNNTPQGGGNNGAVYVPGFGWVQSSGQNQGGQSGSDGDWDKQIGNMG